MASNVTGGSWTTATGKTTPDEQATKKESPMVRAMEQAKSKVGIVRGSRTPLLSELKALKLLHDRVHKWKADSPMDLKLKFETIIGIDLAISKTKLALHVEELDSILLKE